MTTIDFSIVIDNDLYNKYYNEYEAGNYTSAIKTSILYLTECIRERTNLDLDGDQLITQSFSITTPYIKLNDLKTDTEKNEQIGTMMILQGIYKAIRNPRNHNLKIDDRFTCDSIIVLINYFVCLIKKAKLLFDYEDFYSIVIDKYFDKSEEYSEELIKSIPQDKLLETNIRLVDSIDDDNYQNASFIIFSSLKQFSKDDLKDFLRYCGKVLLKTDNYSTIKTLTYALRDVWTELEKPVCLRIENILIEALRKLEIENESYYDNSKRIDYTIINDEGKLAKSIVCLPMPFSKNISLLLIQNIINQKLLEGNDYIDYLFEYMHKFLFSETGHLNSAFNNTIMNLIDSNGLGLYTRLTKKIINDNQVKSCYTFDEKVEKALQRFVDSCVDL